MAKTLLTQKAVLLLRDIENHLEKSGVSRSTFGLDAVGDGHFIRRLEIGREPRDETIKRVRDYLFQNRHSANAARRRGRPRAASHA